MNSSADQDVATLVAQLSADASPQVAVHAARTVKNAIIANPTNKRLYLQHGVLNHLVACASQVHLNSTLAEHAVAALGSLASYLTPDNVSLVTNALLTCLFSTNMRSVYAATRSLKLLVCSPPVDVDVDVVAKHVVIPNVAAKLVSLLSTPDEGVAEVAAVIIAHTADCGNQYVRVYYDAGAVPALVALLIRTIHERCTEASINALTALARRLDEISITLTSTHNVIPYLMPLIRTPIHSLRLATCRLLTTFHLSNRLPSGFDASVTKAIVTLLTWNSHSALDVAAQTLAELIVDSKDLQRVAKESGAVGMLADILLADHEPIESEREVQPFSDSSLQRDVQMTEHSSHDNAMMDDAEEEMSKLLRFSALSAISALTMLFDPARDAVIAKNLLPLIVEGLADDNAMVVEGGISCIRSLSRSVKILREKLSDDEVIGKRVVALLDTDNKQILRMATAALCNLVLEFSPVRKVVLEMNGIKTVIDLLKSKDEVVRKNCVWVLKNLLFKADVATKNGVLSKLGHESLRALFTDEQPKVRSLAMTVVRNLACSSGADTQNEQLDALFSITGVELISMLSAVLNYDPASDIELVIQALYVVCNIASGTEQHKAFLLESDIPQLILKWTCHADDRIRIAAVWCTINLSWRDNTTGRQSELGLTQSQVSSQTQSTPPHRRHLRVMRRALRGPNRSLYEGRLQMMLRQQHLPLPASPAGRHILERYPGAMGSGNPAADGARLGSASSDGGNDDMWLADRDAPNNNAVMMDEDAAAGDIDGNHSESNQSDESNGNGDGNNRNSSNNNNDTNASATTALNSSSGSNNADNNSSEMQQEIQPPSSSDANAMQMANENEAHTRTDDDSDVCPSGYEASGSGGVDGSAGEGDHSGSNSSVGKSCGYEWRIERLRQLGFEGRLRSLINDPHIEVQGRARAALQLFDCTDINPLDYSPSTLLNGNRTSSSQPDGSRNNFASSMFLRNNPPSL